MQYHPSWVKRERLWPWHEFLLCVLWPWPWQYWFKLIINGKSLDYRQQSCESSFRSKMPMKSYNPDIDFRCMCTLTLEIWPLVKVMTHHLVMGQLIQHGRQESWPAQGFWPRICVLTLTFEIWPGQSHDTPLVRGQQSYEVLLVSRLNMAEGSYGPGIDFVCVHWPWRYNLGSRSWHILGSYTDVTHGTGTHWRFGTNAFLKKMTFWNLGLNYVLVAFNIL